MSDNSRKLQKQNPLLTAAGQGFPFEDFSANTLLMPVTPAAPEPVYQEDVPLPSHAGTIDDVFPRQSSLVPDFLPQVEQFPTITSPVKNPAIETQQQQQQQQGYFTSILSSLPNLSLSSIKGQQQTPLSQPTFLNSTDPTLTTENFQINTTPQDSSSVQYSTGLPTGFNNPSRPSAPPVGLPPPSVNPPTGGPVSSYRLGNQRRLKYAPPPDLATAPAKPLATSTIGSVNPLDVGLKPELFNPSYPTQCSQSDSTGFFEPVGNFSCPPSTGIPSGASLSVPQDIPSSNTHREPITPHNTPANYFLNRSAFEVNYQSTRNDLDSVSGPPTIDSLSQSVSDVTSPENLADIDLSQRSSPLVTQTPQQLPSALLASDFSVLQPPTNFFSSNVSNAISQPSKDDFFETKNPLKPVETVPFASPQVEQQVSSPISFYNPLDFESNRLPQCDIDSQSAISSTFNLPLAEGSSSTSSGNWSVPRATLLTSEMPEPTGSATLNPIQTSINPLIGRTQTHDTIPPSLHSLAAGAEKKMQYRPVYHHWFYRKEVENKVLWHPFSMHDSLNLEAVHNSSEITPETRVATDGGRYDVEILKRQRSPVYWPGTPAEVRRSSWFYKGPSESRYVPYEESIAARLEEEYKQACLTEHWNRKVELNNGEYIVFHSSIIQIHYLQASSPELVASWGNNASAASRPKVVKRGVDEFHIEEGEPEKIDHLLFLVHGIGSVCDLKFRSVEEVVDEFRSISLQLVQSHYRTAGIEGAVNRIEVLPISWHTTLHSEDTGIDKKLRAITLESIPRLRHFTNDTLLDVLFYTSPIYCQTIMQTVGNEMNRLHSLFKDRNPDFGGSIYLGGHSLGSLIMFDLLCHQKAPVEETKEEIIEEDENSGGENSVASIKPMPRSILKRRLSRKVSYVMGAAGTGQPFIVYPHLNFYPKAFFALGSPIGMFVTVRGIDTLGENFKLPTCPAFFNIFHPFDPVAYRVESLVNPDAHKYRPMLIPHHKGRKRMHLELKETMARVGADLKQKVLDSVRSTWNSVYQLAMFHRSDNQVLEQEIDKVVEEELQKSPQLTKQSNNLYMDGDGDERGFERGADYRFGKLNGGRRIDYVLQEAPFEYINEYIFALTSHVCYWESEDTMLMILKEIYSSNGIQADAQLPQQTMTIERQSFSSQSTASTPGTSISTTDSATNSSTIPTRIGVDPTVPMSSRTVGPPPVSGFVSPRAHPLEVRKK